MKVTLIGAGPGDPGLLTLRGREVLSQADVVIYDALANPGLLTFAKPGAELIYVGKIADQHALPQDQINELLVKKAREKGNVARLKGGDPYIFGRGGEEGEYVVSHGIDFEEVPGVSSAIAAPAYAGIPLTHRDFTSSVMLITGHEKPGKAESSHDWQAFVKSGATLVFVMGMKNLHSICANLIDAGMNSATPGAVIYRGATPFQRCVIAPVQDLAKAAEKASLSNPAVIVIGKVASLAGKLDWFARKPLLGKRIVITRSREQASDLASMLTEQGAAVIEFPTIAIQPMPEYTACDSAIASLSGYSWLIFTSVNGVKFFWQRLEKAGNDSRALGSIKVAAIGPATAASLAARGVIADLLPKTYVAEDVAASLIQREGGKLAGMKILLPRAAEARMTLPDELAKGGAIVDVVPVYETVPAHGNTASLLEMLKNKEIDCLTFGSSSTVRNLLALIPASELKAHPEVKLAAIGPITNQELAKNGLTAQIQAQFYTIPGLVEAISEYFRQAKP